MQTVRMSLIDRETKTEGQRQRDDFTAIMITHNTEIKIID